MPKQSKRISEKSIGDLEIDITKIHKSTRTALPFLVSAHHGLRMKFNWYYRWHLWSHHQLAQNVLVSLILATFVLLGYQQYLKPGEPKNSKAAAATCYWVGDTNPANWNDASHWANAPGGVPGTCDGGVVPGSDDTVVFDAANTNSATVDVEVNVASFSVGTSSYTGTVNGNGSNVNVSGDFTFRSGNLNLSTGTWTVSGNWSTNGLTSMTKGTSTVVLNGSGKNLNTHHSVASHFNNLTISNNISTNTAGGDGTDVDGLFKLDPGVTLSLTSGYGGITVDDSGTSDIDGTINGPATFHVSGILDSGGTLNCPVEFSATSNRTDPARVYGGSVRLYHPGSANISHTFGAGTVDIHGNLTVIAHGNGNVTFNAATNNPDVNVDGYIDYTGTGGGTEIISAGSGTWRVTGNVDFSGGSFNPNGSNFILSGNGSQSVTSAGQAFNNLEIANASSSGVTFADSTAVTTTLTDNTAGSRLNFASSSSFSINSININGSENNKIMLRSTNDGSQFNIWIPTAGPKVSYVDAKDSNATGNAIDATDGTSTNSGNNTNWLWPDAAANTSAKKSITTSTTDDSSANDLSQVLDQESLNINQDDSDSDLGIVGGIVQSISNITTKIAESPFEPAILGTIITASALSATGSTAPLASPISSLLMLNFGAKDAFFITINYFYSIFAVRRKRKSSLVYDQNTGQPVAGALVYLYKKEINSLKLTNTAITDRSGKFIFAVNKGQYVISVVKRGYIFPSYYSKKIMSDNEQYVGQTLTFDHDSSTVDVKIPVNATGEAKSTKTFLHALFFSGTVRLVILSLGTVLSVAVLISNPNTTGFVVNILYLLLWLVEFYIQIRIGRMSQVIDKHTGKPIDLALIRIVTREGKYLQTIITDITGHFALKELAAGNRLIIKRKGYQDIEEVVPDRGFLKNKIFRLSKKLDKTDEKLSYYNQAAGIKRHSIIKYEGLGMTVRKRTQILILTFLIFVLGLVITLSFSPIGKELTLTYFYKADTAGRTYYVAAEGGGGSDSNPGTLDQPWATLAYAKGIVAAGDTVYLRGGTHYLADDVIISKDGTSSAPIKFASYPGERAVIDCSREPAGSSCISSSGDYHIFENLDIANSSYYGLNIAGGARGTHVNGCKIYNHMNDNIKVNLAWDWTIENSEIYDEPDYQDDDGIDTFAFNGIIRNNYIHDNSYFGVLVKGGSENVEIYGNRLINNARSDNASGSLVLGGAAGLHYKKTIEGTKDATVYEGTNINAYNNLIVSKGPGVTFWECDSCSAYNNTIYQKDVNQRVVYTNSNLHKNDDGSIKWQNANDGCFIDGTGNCNCTPAEMCDLCPSNAPANPLCRHDTRNATFKNNIIYFQNTRSGLSVTPDNAEGFVSSNNLWYGVNIASGYKAFETGYWLSATRYDTVEQLNGANANMENNSLMANPQFEDIAALNFRLSDTSPAINHGTNDITSLIHSPLSDLAGVVRPQGAAVDIGAYEYDGSDPPATNHDPILTSVGNKSVNEGSALSFTISATDSDGDTLTYSASGLPSGAAFTAGTRTFAWTPSDAQSGTYNITFSVSDGKGGSDSETIVVTVNDVAPVNHAPVLSSIGNKTVNENSLLSFSISGSDTDGDTISYSTSNLPTGATFNAVTKTFSWIPSYSQSGTYTGVHFEIFDGELTDYEDITITVNNVNRSPILTRIGDKSVNEGNSLSFAVVASDPDGGALTYSATNLPSGAAFNTSTKLFSWTPSNSQSGSYNVTFSVRDSLNLTTSETIKITVNDVPENPPPSNPPSDPPPASYKSGDINHDGRVDLLDLSIIASNWEQRNSSGDLNGDGVIDLLDLSILAANWEG